MVFDIVFVFVPTVGGNGYKWFSIRTTHRYWYELERDDTKAGRDSYDDVEIASSRLNMVKCDMLRVSNHHYFFGGHVARSRAGKTSTIIKKRARA